MQLGSFQNDTVLHLILPQGQSVIFDVEGGGIRVEDRSWHPQFGLSVPNLCLAVDFEEQKVRTNIQWSENKYFGVEFLFPAGSLCWFLSHHFIGKATRIHVNPRITD